MLIIWQIKCNPVNASKYYEASILCTEINADAAPYLCQVLTMIQVTAFLAGLACSSSTHQCHGGVPATHFYRNRSTSGRST